MDTQDILMNSVAEDTSGSRLIEAEWVSRQTRHRERLEARIASHLARRSAGKKHPVYDFLFEYYSFRPAHLMKWTPGAGVTLEKAEGCFSVPFRTRPDGSVFLSWESFPEHRKEGAIWCLTLLEETASRTPQFTCYGLHEWAMVVEKKDIRHSQLPLRLKHSEIVAFVQSQPLCCTHFDAFRFFSASARPWNKYRLHRGNRVAMEQRGCLHANMDLYKWAYKAYPWIDSETMADAFELAWDIREVDMRASPYDVTLLELEPICLESEKGRREYLRLQQTFSERAVNIRERMIVFYRKGLSLLLNA